MAILGFRVFALASVLLNRSNRTSSKITPRFPQEVVVIGKKNEPKTKTQQGFVTRLRAKLNRGKSWLTYDFATSTPSGKVDEDVLEDLETDLVMADVGVEASQQIIAGLRKALTRKERKHVDAVRAGLQSALEDILTPVAERLEISGQTTPFVILVVGVNGVGKTTTIGKLANLFRANGKTVMLAAGDTFRAAAIEQLQAWGKQNNVPVIAQQKGADPAAVVFDAYKAAKSRGIDVLLADTAGRLQSQQGLMDELQKMQRVLSRYDEKAPQEIMLVLDASQGQNALLQAQKFDEALGVTGITITKLDGSAKGGILIAIAHKLRIPVRFIGIGEAGEDMQPFDAADYVGALLSKGS
jgi:fused signal recognition particle receptor